MRAVARLGSVVKARRVNRCLLVACPGRDGESYKEALRSLQQAGVTAEVYFAPADSAGLCPAPCAADAVSAAARDTGAELLVGMGPGGVLDLAKAGAALAPLAASASGDAVPSTSHFLLGGPGAATLLPGASLPLILVPTTAAVAATSGRCLLRTGAPFAGALVPLAVAGPGPFGVGLGLQAVDVVADAALAARQSARGTAAAGAHALSVFADSAAAAAGTIKEEMLRDDMAAGLCSAAVALRQPADATVDALQAALAAGVAASDADANARGGLSVVHALACVLAGARPGLPFGAACGALLPPVLRAWASRAEGGGLCEAESEGEADDAEAVVRSLALLAEDVLPPRAPQRAASAGPQGPAAPLRRLAAFVEERCAAAGLPPGLPLAPGECLESAAALLAVRASGAAALWQRPSPGWLREPRALTGVFRAALAGPAG
ncbi:unnamed protein product [Prorocentrum cordatum]|uniref:Alcohol dehydrogenase iron-type/glycerol dehydrogenase GldA domain-containing protein n=1 Tax=Prorocentrum cordatum TaxID=2364126 RepID=A0ABN9U987_9DINO|nr:unnamed protein product [Polarella glacialis]